MAREYVTTAHLEQLLERLAVNQAARDQLRRDTVARAQAARDDRPRTGAIGAPAVTKGGDT